MRSRLSRLGRPRALAPELVARIVGEREAGASLGTIAARLDAEGQPTAMGGARWYRSTVRAVLQSAALDAEYAAQPEDENGSPHATGRPGSAGTRRPPVASGDIIGRERELAELTERLGETRVLTLTGPAGVGKTRLAAELAGGVSDDGHGPVAWVELARVGRPSLVPRAAAAALGLSEQSGRPISDILVSYLATRRLLLVLDNCEHLLPAARELAETLLQRCPALTVLATSQQALAMAGEWAHRVPPLSLWDAGGAEPGALATSPAVRLFCERAADARRGFRLTPETATAVEEICHRLDGIPLAIELAAARVTVLTPAEIASRLGDRFDLLTAGSPDAEERHHTLRAALDWSCDLLRPAERTLLWRLSIFSGGCSLSAIEAVCGFALGTDERVLDSLSALVARSLVVADTSGDQARYSLLESIRLHAAERLEDTAEAREVGRRHLQWCLELAEAADPELSGPDQLAWLDRLDLEHDNLRSGLARATGEGDSEAALRLAGALTLFWRVRGHFREGRGWLEAALGLGDGADARIRSRALWGLGFLALMLNDIAAASPALEQALALALETGDLSGEARTLLLLGNASVLTEASREPVLLQESAALARQAEDPWCLGHALAMLGWAHLKQGDVAAARPVLEECLEVGRRAREPQSLRIGLNMMGNLAVSQGEFDRAEGLLTEGLRVTRRLREPFDIAAALHSLGQLAARRGREAGARSLLQEALAFARLTAMPLFIDSSLCDLGSLTLDQGDAAAARGFFEESATVMRAAGLASLQSLQGLGDVAIAEGDLDGARGLLAEALELASARADRPALVRIRVSLGALARAEGDLERATEHQHAALRLRRELDDHWGFPQSLEALGGLAAQAGQAEHAVRLMGAAQAIRDASGHARPRRHQADYEADLAAAGRGTAGFDAAWAQGMSLTAAEAVALATKGRGARDRRPREGWSSLTQAQRSVAALVADGLTNTQIAERLFISRYTVEGHLSRIYGKLGIESRSQLVRESLHRGDKEG